MTLSMVMNLKILYDETAISFPAPTYLKTGLFQKTLVFYQLRIFFIVTMVAK